MAYFSVSDFSHLAVMSVPFSGYCCPAR